MAAKKKYNHAVDVAFQVISDHAEEPTLDEMLEGMERRLKNLKENQDEAKEAFGVYDTFETEPE